MEQDEFSVPKEFDQLSHALYAKETITQREFVDFCLQATGLVGRYWSNRQGFAYHIAGLWLKHKNVEESALLDQIGAAFGRLELPDKQIASNEDAVRKEWTKVQKLVDEADKTFSKSNQ